MKYLNKAFSSQKVIFVNDLINCPVASKALKSDKIKLNFSDSVFVVKQ